MVERRELITICRQIGTMMEVGVDFLRLTRSLREQTENPRLLELYDQLELDMRMGENMADAIAKAPDVFSPFAVSLIRQGEARGDIEGAWHRLADFLKQEAQQDKDLGLDAVFESQNGGATGLAPLQRAAGTLPRGLNPTFDWNGELRRWFGLGAAFLAALSVVWTGVNLELIAPRSLVPLQLGIAALFSGLAAWKPRLSAAKIAKTATMCAFCGQAEGESGVLARSSLVAGAAICPRCAAAFGHEETIPGETLSETAKKQSAAQIEMARDFAEGFPERFHDRATLNQTNGVAPEFEIGGEDDDDGGSTPHQEKRFQL